MAKASELSAPQYVLEGFLLLEKDLGECLSYVPYCQEHLSVWSPRFTAIIFEAASQLDSLWRVAAVVDGKTQADDRPTVGTYLSLFGPSIAKQWAVFFGVRPPQVIRPFAPWQSSTFKPHDYKNHKLQWWESYKALKHNRLDHAYQATLENAIDSVGALFIGIVYSGICDTALLDAEIFHLSVGQLGDRFAGKFVRDVPATCYGRVESKLFAHPLGWCDKRIDGQSWVSSRSFRFQSWWKSFRQSGGDPNSLQTPPPPPTGPLL